MTKVFVHGNPETAEVWSELVPALNRRGIQDIVLLSPPGFGAAVPAGFGSTRIEYRDWLIAELEKIGGEIDLVGHDWGAGHTYAAVACRPDLLRSWSADCAGLVHPAYEWHPAAQVWQRQGEGRPPSPRSSRSAPTNSSSCSVCHQSLRQSWPGIWTSAWASAFSPCIAQRCSRTCLIWAISLRPPRKNRHCYFTRPPILTSRPKWCLTWQSA